MAPDSGLGQGADCFKIRLHESRIHALYYPQAYLLKRVHLFIEFLGQKRSSDSWYVVTAHLNSVNSANFVVRD